MGFPVGYSELLLPRLVLNAAYLLGFIRSTICCLLRCLGLTDFLEPESSWPNQNEPSDSMSSSVSVSAATIRERLPVVAFGVLAKEEDVTCAVCLSELKREEEIRRLSKCMHIFHRDCLDKWLDHGHKTCPLCRSPFLSQGQGKEISEHLLWAIDRCSILNEGVTSIFS